MKRNEHNDTEVANGGDEGQQSRPQPYTAGEVAGKLGASYAETTGWARENSVGRLGPSWVFFDEDVERMRADIYGPDEGPEVWGGSEEGGGSDSSYEEDDDEYDSDDGYDDDDEYDY